MTHPASTSFFTLPAQCFFCLGPGRSGHCDLPLVMFVKLCREALIFSIRWLCRMVLDLLSNHRLRDGRWLYDSEKADHLNVAYWTFEQLSDWILIIIVCAIGAVIGPICYSFAPSSLLSLVSLGFLTRFWSLKRRTPIQVNMAKFLPPRYPPLPIFDFV